MGRRWWEEAVFYQIYPRSFMDSNGDGIGDLEGITSKLEYLQWLGVDTLWLSPFFPSPMRDFGYDVTDYRGIDPIFGSTSSFVRLMGEAKRREIKIVLDLVANHSSDEHPWFAEARASRESPRHGWYLWVPETGRPPNNWKAVFEFGTAWHPNPQTKERYLGTFTRHQPEFDWRNGEVRAEFYDIMRYWYGLGVDGFRLDVATAYTKDPALRSNPFSFAANPDFFQRHIHDRNHPDFHAIFKEMRAVADKSPAISPGASRPGERVLIGETYGQSLDLAASCYGKADDELHMAFNFDFLNQPWKAEAFRRSAERWYAILPDKAWPSFTLSNHDKPRHIWRYRTREPGITEGRAKMAAAMLLCLRGTPFLYYGEEIGMSCHRLPRKALRDPLGARTWPLGFLGRDPERRPMQWDASPGAGFGSDAPWLPLDPDWRACNVAAQRGRPDSLLSWYRDLLALRRATPALRRGALHFQDTSPDVLAWERRASCSETPEQDSIIVYLNFASRPVDIALAEPAEVLLGTRRPRATSLDRGTLRLEACEVIIAKIREGLI